MKSEKKYYMKYDSIFSNEFQEIFLNNEVVPSEEGCDIVSDWVQTDLTRVLECPYCQTKLWRGYHEEEIEGQGEWVERCLIVECPRCAYWHADWYQDLGQGYTGCPTAEWEAHISKLCEFSSHLPEGCHSELSRHLRANPNLWCALSPLKVEKLVADIFLRNFCHCEVMHVGKPGDGGIDVVFVDSGKHRWLIQVKRRERLKAAEGVETIRNLLGVMVLEGDRFGAVVSTADHFTYSAYKAKQRAYEKGYTISLLDRGRLDRMVEPLLPSRQWVHLIKKRKPEWLSLLSDKMPDRRQLTFRDYIQHLNDLKKR